MFSYLLIFLSLVEGVWQVENPKIIPHHISI